VKPQRQLDSKLEVLCDILNEGQGGFVGLIKRELKSMFDVPLSSKAIRANEGRTLYPQLQALCNFLNAEKRGR
jgi:hypothetical protein